MKKSEFSILKWYFNGLEYIHWLALNMIFSAYIQLYTIFDFHGNKKFKNTYLVFKYDYSFQSLLIKY